MSVTLESLKRQPEPPAIDCMCLSTEHEDYGRDTNDYKLRTNTSQSTANCKIYSTLDRLVLVTTDT